MQISDLSWDVILIIAAFIILITSIYNALMTAIKHHLDAKKRRNAPVDNLSTRTDEALSRLAAHDTMLANDKKRLDSIDEQQRIQLRALMAMLSHEINGNSVEKLQSSMTEIHDWLIGK